LRKNIDIDEVTLRKLKLISAFKNNSVKGLMEEAVRWFVAQKEKQYLNKFIDEEKEDLVQGYTINQKWLAQHSQFLCC